MACMRVDFPVPFGPKKTENGLFSGWKSKLASLNPQKFFSFKLLSQYMQMKTFQQLLSEIDPHAAAEEITTSAFDRSIQPDSIIAEFDVSGGVMKAKGKANTWIRFDCNPGVIKNLIQIMSEVGEVCDDDVQAMDRWRGEVSKILETDMLHRIREAIRERILGGAPPEVIPLHDIQITDVDISDLPEDDCVLVIKKSTPQGEETSPVAEDIFGEKGRTGETIQQVVDRRKREGDPRYKWVVDVEQRKHFFEVTVSISADYSLSSPEGG